MFAFDFFHLFMRGPMLRYIHRYIIIIHMKKRNICKKSN